MPRDKANHTPAKQFRLGESTRTKLRELAKHFDVNETDVVRMLVADCHARVASGRKIDRKSGLPS